MQQDGHALRYVEQQTDEICLAAVQQDGHALQYVKQQTDEICLAAMQRDGDALRHVVVLSNVWFKPSETNVDEHRVHRSAGTQQMHSNHIYH